MTWSSEGLFVKVCGLKTRGDIDVAMAAGADALGFVWWEPSPRHIALESIAELAVSVPVRTVLVTVDLPPGELVEAASRAEVTAVQPHGRHSTEAADAAAATGLDAIRPLRAGESPGPVPERHLLLMDTPDPDLPGGTGRSFDWALAADFGRPYLLAGGLTPDNVGAAVRMLRPFGVDASSGLESSPGSKDPDLIRRFVEEAKGS
ncbi:phosphoribosylanthranilate isomerase [soil metagenome]